MVEDYMSWEGGVDFLGIFNGASEPNLIVHVARMVNSLVGSAPAGMILVQPDSGAPPKGMGFISPDPAVGAYFGPKIFAGTPFENAPVLEAQITILKGDDGSLISTIEVGGKTITCGLSDFGALESINREPGGMNPFSKQVLEAPAQKAEVTIDGAPIEVIVPPQGLGGGAGAVSTPAGIYAR